MKTTIQNQAIELYQFLDTEHMKRVKVCAGGCLADWNNQQVNLLDWKIDSETKMVKIIYTWSDSPTAAILDANLPIIEREEPISPPNKSKNWEFSTFSNCWHNKKTGERVQVCV